MRWHHQCNGHELGQTSGVGEGQGGLATVHGVAKSRTWLGDWMTTITFLSNIRRLVPSPPSEDVFPDYLLKIPLSFSSQYSLLPSLFFLHCADCYLTRMHLMYSFYYFQSLSPSRMLTQRFTSVLFTALSPSTQDTSWVDGGCLVNTYQVNEWMINIALELWAQANLNSNLGARPY